jgi:RNA polymerase sigma-70 factor (ECF subfamily)
MSREVIEGIARGNRKAFIDFYNRVSVPLVEFIYFRSGGDIERARDVFQEAFARLIKDRKRVAKLDSDEALFPWLCGVARRILADYYRGRKNTQAISLDRLDPVLQDALLQIEDGELDAEAAAHPQLQMLVGMALSSLKPEHADLLKAKYCEKRSVERIADSMGESAKVIEGRLYRAREAFRAAFTRMRKEIDADYARL